MDIATCIGCRCTDHAACHTADGPCHWLDVDYGAGVGVCSGCPEHLPRWNAGDRRIAPLIVAKIVRQGEEGAEPFYLEANDMGSMPTVLGTEIGATYSLEWVVMSESEFHALPQFRHIHRAKDWVEHMKAAQKAKVRGQQAAYQEHLAAAQAIAAELDAADWDVEQLARDFLNYEAQRI